jgi:hypothetical protein
MLAQFVKGLRHTTHITNFGQPQPKIAVLCIVETGTIAARSKVGVAPEHHATVGRNANHLLAQTSCLLRNGTGGNDLIDALASGSHYACPACAENNLRVRVKKGRLLSQPSWKAHVVRVLAGDIPAPGHGATVDQCLSQSLVDTGKHLHSLVFT